MLTNPPFGKKSSTTIVGEEGKVSKERVVLYCLNKTQTERNGRNVPTAMLYGRVVEYVNMSEQELQAILQRLSSYNSNPVT